MFKIEIASSLSIGALLALSLCTPTLAQDQAQLRPAIDTNKPTESVKTPLIKDTDASATNTPIGQDKVPPPPSLEELHQLVQFSAASEPIKREPNLIGIKIEVQNNSQTPLMFDGEKAVIHAAGQNIPAIATVEKKISMKQAFTKETNAAVLAGVTVGAYPTIRDMKNQKGPILERYGSDATRRQNISERFGKRILWPGDISQGVVFVREGEKIAGALVEIPVGTFPEMKMIGTIQSSAASTRINP